MKPTAFIQTDAGLLAQNDEAYLLLSPAHGTLVYETDSLIEETVCNCLAQSHTGEDIQLTIDDQPAETLGFLRGGHALWGRIDAGDRLGRIRFCLQRDNREILCADLHVRPAKLDYETDFLTMRADLERICRNLLYALPTHARIATQTHDDAGTVLDFYQLLNQLAEPLFQTCRAILSQPNRRLVQKSITQPADRATGCDPDALVHLVRSPSTWTTDKDNHAVSLPAPNQHIGVTTLRETHRRSTVDTPANRHLVARLQQLCRRIQALAEQPQSDPKNRSLGTIRIKIQRLLHNPVLQPVHPARADETFPAHLDARYQRAFALLRDLNHSLGPILGGPFDLSYRDTPTLYEYWTYFTVVQTLLDMGFTPQSTGNLFHLTDRALTVSPTQGEPSAIDLQRGERQVRCLYNLTYSRASGRALTHDLRPDIILEVHTRSTTIHAFDAKYRRENAGTCWAPLRDDIDKMHAYRDAIGQITPRGFQRALRSAVVLFPASSEPAYQSHPFCESLKHGIGGLPLLPGDPTTQSALRTHLQRCLTT